MHRVTARAWLLVALMVGSAAFAGVGVGTATAEEVPIEVTVVDQNGDGLGGATLMVSWDGGSKTVTTVSNGRALFDVPEDKRITIEVDVDDYVRNEPYVIENPSPDDSIEIPMHEDALATVTVGNAQGPIENADVRLVKDGVAVIDGQTDSEGVIESDLIEVGTYELDVVKRGYYRNTTTIDARGHVRPTVVLERGSVTATVNVVDTYYDPPQPIENVTVEVGSISTSNTLSNGETTFQVPVNSRPTAVLSKDDYETKSVPMTIGERPRTFNLTLSRSPALTISPSADRVVVGENVSVTVTDEYGDTVPNATVSVNGETIGTTGPQGTLSVPVESAGDHTISVETDAASQSVTITGFDPGGSETTTAPSMTTTTSAPTTTTDEGTSSAFGPGFGPIVAVVALIAVALVARRRR